MFEKAVQVGASRLEWKNFVENVSFEPEPGMRSECVMEGESGVQVGDKLDSNRRKLTAAYE